MVFQKIDKVKILIFLLLLLFACLILLALFLNKKTETNLLKTILPENIETSKNISQISENMSSTVKVIYEGKSEEEAQELKENFLSEIDKEYFQPQIINISDFLNLYKLSPTNFLSYKTRELLKNRKYKTVRENAIRELYNPIAFQLIDFSDDPYYLFSDFIKSSENSHYQNNKLNGKYFITQELNILKKDNQNKKIKELIKIQKKYSFDSQKIYLAGVPIHTYHTSKNSAIFINIVCVLSTILIAFLTFIYFKDFFVLLPVFISIFFGLTIGFISVNIIFHEFHILTFVFGTTLIGIGIDYSYHYLFNKENNKVFSKSLLLSMLTTIIAFSLLYFSHILILKQISVFMITGLISIYLFVKFIYPHFALPAPQNTVKVKIKAVKYIVVFIIFASAFGFLKLSFDDSLSAFYTPNKILKDTEKLYNDISKNNSNKIQMIKINGTSIEDMLLKEEKIADILNKNSIEYFSISKFLPSEKRQKENIKLVNELYKNDLKNFSDILTNIQINHLLNEKRNPIKFDIKNIPYIKNLLLQNNSSIILVYGNNLPDAIKEKISIIDINKDVSSYLLNYRIKLEKLFPITILCILLILSLIYGIKKSIKILLVPILGSICALGIVSLFGSPLTFFSILAPFLILGFTIDYSIFRSEGGRKSEDGILISFITTSFSFLALSFTSFKFISSFSLILFLGISISYMAGLVLFSDEREQI